jgi:hypothetical protein
MPADLLLLEWQPEVAQLLSMIVLISFVKVAFDCGSGSFTSEESVISDSEADEHAVKRSVKKNKINGKRVRIIFEAL